MPGTSLKKMVLHGFKSFANRTEVLFSSGANVIVGPNGCGKTNILEALRWVLGEQSARSLRGRVMQDVIFSGTEKRKALGFCEVVLVFNNEEGFFPIPTSEVEVSRRVYRSGEGEYSINNTAVRLRDVQELFMDTGLGVRNYAFLEQGQMDRILIAKPLDRRAPFEEVAGIHRYRVRQHEAETKLFGVQTNLNRVSDLLRQMVAQLEKLEAQARRAREFREVQEKLKKFTSRALHLEGYQLITRLERLDSKGKSYSVALEKYKKEEVQLHENLDDSRMQRREAEKKLIVIQDDKTKFDRESHRQELDVVYLQKLKEEFKRKMESVANELSDLRQDVVELTDPAKRRQLSFNFGTRRSEIEQEREVVVKEMKSLAKDIKRLEEVSESSGEEIELSLKHRHDSAGDLGRVEGLLEDIGKRLNALIQKKEVLRDEAKDFSEKEKDVKNLTQTTGDKLASLDRQEKALQTESHGIGDRLSRAQSQREANQIRAKEMAAPAAGTMGRNFPRNPQDVLAGLDVAFPSVLEKLEIQKGYAKAVDACLGSGAWSALASDLGQASKILQMGGQALRIDEGGPDPIVLEGSLAEKVKSASLSKRVLDRLFGRVLVVDDIEGLEDTDRAWSHFPADALALVSRDGGYLSHLGWTNQGGSQQLLRTILQAFEKGLKMESSRLESENIVLEKDISSLTQAKAEVENRISNLQKDQVNTREAVSTARENQAKVLSQSQQTSESLRELELQIKDLSKAEQGLTKEAASFREKLTVLSLRTDDLKEHQDHQKRLDEQRRLNDRFESRLEEIERQKAQLTQDETILNKQRIEDRKRLLEEKISGQVKEAQRVTASLAEGEESVRKAEEKMSKHLSMRPKKEAALESARAARQTREAKEEVLMLHREEVGSLVRDSESNVNQVEIKRVEAQTELNLTKARHLEEIGDPLPPSKPDSRWDLPDVKRELRSLKGKSAALQNVNMEALSELEEIRVRVKTLSGQQKDLLEADADLRKIIKEVSGIALKKFEKTFKEVQTHFASLFKRLFGGGEAKVYLTDPNIPLESGIEILVRPPGKKVQIVTLLSGGERALASIALTLTLFRIKPSPLCVLDELDAPLDDRNVSRFIEIIKEFLDRSQFVVVTHNKLTMEMADILYGVTMEERGVSKLVAVRLGAKAS